MTSTTYLTLGLGLVAQLFFSARILVQWFISEKNHKVVSPNAFWTFSIAGSILFFIYGWLRDDFAIILGQFLSYYIYMWNIHIKGLYEKMPRFVPILQLLLPVVAVAFTINNLPQFIHTFLRNDEIPIWVVVWGSLGQIIFTLRFVYQWFYSHRRKESLLPITFWVISLIGSFIIVSYGMYRRDIILILGQSFGFVAYIRNIWFCLRNNRWKKAV